MWVIKKTPSVLGYPGTDRVHRVTGNETSTRVPVPSTSSQTTKRIRTRCILPVNVIFRP